MSCRRRAPALAAALLAAACVGFRSRAGLITEIGPGQQATIEADGAHYTVVVRAWGEGEISLVCDGPPPLLIGLGGRGSAQMEGEGRRTFRVRNDGAGKASVDLTVRGATYANLIGPVPKP